MRPDPSDRKLVSIYYPQVLSASKYPTDGLEIQYQTIRGVTNMSTEQYGGRRMMVVIERWNWLVVNCITMHC